MPEKDLKILMIDDDEQILFALRAVFNFQGWQSLSAGDVPTGLDIFRRENGKALALPGYEWME